MTARRIDPRNYLELAGGREDIAAALQAQDLARADTLHRGMLIERKIVPMLGSLSTEQLEIIATTTANMANINTGGIQNG